MHKIIREDLENIALSVGDKANKLEGKTLLISGGSGFLGSYIVGVIKLLNEKTLKTPCRIISIDNFITGSRSNFLGEDKNVTYIEGDVSKPISIKEEVNFIIHAAGIASPVYYQKFPLETIDGAIFGAKNLLEYAKTMNNFESFLFTSSSEIYGDPHPDFIPTPETYKGNVSSIGPRSCYDESKRLAETICMTYFRQHKTPVKIIRPFNIYGPGMKNNDYRVIPNFISQGLRGDTLTVHDKGVQTRTFCYVTDAIAAIFKVLLSDKNGEVFNVGNDNDEISIAKLAENIVPLLPRKVGIKLVKYPDTYPTDEPSRRCPDITKIKKELGFEPRINLVTGLKRTILWFEDIFKNEQ